MRKGVSCFMLMRAMIMILVVGLIMWYLFFGTTNSEQSTENINKFDAPRRVRKVLVEIDQLLSQVDDPELQNKIDQIRKDTVAYFQKYSVKVGRDAKQFENLLRSILQVLQKYLDVQNNSRYYNEPAQIMSQGKEVIVGFSDHVLKICRHESEIGLYQFHFDTEILSLENRTKP